ncbi:carboxymuconolactone decarboxylase [Fusarium beomiforme]|uniref:Carboxymuconolactone decarboxylase n=1 Tax=Fusarium beomiforme TaxID=44412 RepID=A0A9P5AJK0_9HYPO|nr:carboxymuconolactone decarboxylase [Fusarium beomiforme]
MTLENILDEFVAREQAEDITKARWYIVAAVALTSAAAGPEVTRLYQKSTYGHGIEIKKLIQRRVKEAILKTSALYGIPRSLQALMPLFNTLKDEEVEDYGPRWEASQADEATSATIAKERREKACSYFDTVWTPAAAQANRDKLFKYHRDLYYLNLQLHYEYYIAEDAILNPIETQMCNIAALICCKCPVQAMWHTRGLINHGGSLEEAKFAQELGLAIAKLTNSPTGDITPVDEIDFEHYAPH